MIKQILVGLDGSDASFQAFKQSCELAGRLSAEVKGIFVVDRRKVQLPYIYAGSSYDISYERIYIPPDPELKEFYRKLNEDLKVFGEKFCKRCGEYAEEHNIGFQYEIKEGFPADVLQEEAHGAGLVVIGQMGENKEYKRAIVGSTTEDLVRKSSRPVLVCPGESVRIDSILLANDGSTGADHALQFYVNALQPVEADFSMLVVCDESESCLEADQAYLHRHDIHGDVINEKGRPTDVILNVAEQKNADLIIIGSHGRNKLKDYILGSTTSHLLRKSSLPVLIVY